MTCTVMVTLVVLDQVIWLQALAMFIVLHSGQDTTLTVPFSAQGRVEMHHTVTIVSETGGNLCSDVSLGLNTDFPTYFTWR